MDASIDLGPALAHYDAHGYACLGQAVAEDTLALLRARAEALMMGEVRWEGLFFQKDTETGRYEDLEYGKGWQGPSLSYRKLDKLELDPLFRALITHPLFERVARARIAGPVAIYRAILFNKPQQGGTVLPWHQDAGRMWGIDRDPELQIWLALDDAPLEAGCLEVVPGSHRGGLVTPLGGLVPEAIARERDAEAHAVALPAQAGDVILVHNHVWHRSGVNRTPRPRRAFSVCYIDAATRCLRTRRAPRQFLRVFE